MVLFHNYSLQLVLYISLPFLRIERFLWHTMGSSWFLWVDLVDEELCDAWFGFWATLYYWIQCCCLLALLFVIYIVVLILLPYWVAPFLIASGHTTPPPVPVMGISVLLHTLGVAVMLVSDAQKYYTLQHKKGLITDGMFKYIRSPNYLGEVMIYASYGLMANVHIGVWIHL